MLPALKMGDRIGDGSLLGLLKNEGKGGVYIKARGPAEYPLSFIERLTKDQAAILDLFVKNASIPLDALLNNIPPAKREFLESLAGIGVLRKTTDPTGAPAYVRGDFYSSTVVTGVEETGFVGAVKTCFSGLVTGLEQMLR